MRTLTRFVIALTAALLAAPLLPAGTSDTAFTYQGRLRDGGLPANGAYNINVSLWDAAAGGTQIGVDIEFNNHPVTSGIFTMELDFGAAAFNGDPRWLEFSVNGSELSPRQAVTNTPGSVQTRGFFVDGSHNVGAGTTSPAARVDAIADATAALEDPFRAGVDDAPGDSMFIRNGTGGPGTFTPWLLGHRETDADQVVFYSGSTSPAMDIGADPIVTFSTYTFDGTNYGPIANRALFQWRNSHVPHMTMDALGNVGIGTVDPDDTLHVSGTSQFDGNVGIGTDPNDLTGCAVTVDQADVRAIRAVSSGPDGQGILASARGTGGLAIQANGDEFDFFASGPGTDYGASSSIRWKSNISPITGPLDKLVQLRGVTFDWDEDHGGHHDVGMIAEEVGQVLPEIVQYEANGVDAIGMDYSKLTPLLVEAVKALQAEHAAQLEALRAENQALRERLDRLESGGVGSGRSAAGAETE